MQHNDLIFMGQNVQEEFYLDVEMMHGNKPVGWGGGGGNFSEKLKKTNP
jgi:hypothetical protein